MAMTAILGGNNSGIPGGGVGADIGGSYHQRDGAGAAAGRTGSGGGTGAGAHGVRRDNNGAEPNTARPPPSIDNSMRDGGEAGAWAATDPESFLRENLSLKDLVSLAYMFNFVEAGVLGLGERKAVVQVRKAGQKRGIVWRVSTEDVHVM